MADACDIRSTYYERYAFGTYLDGLRLIEEEARKNEELTMKASRIAALFAAAVAFWPVHQAEAASFDVAFSGSVGSISNAGSSGPFLEIGDLFSTSFTVDVEGPTVNSIIGTVTFDGMTSDITGIDSFGGSFSGDLYLRLRFEDLGPGLVAGSGVLIDDLEFFLNTSGQRFPNLETALEGPSSLLSSRIVVSTVSSVSVSNARGSLLTTSFSVEATPAPVPLPATSLLLLGAVASLGFVRRRNQTAA